MLTEPDMQARYVAATLSVIEAELRKMAPADCGALCALVSAATRVATRLAKDLGQPMGPGGMRLPADRGKVLPFKR
jgi:hypothetical protein